MASREEQIEKNPGVLAHKDGFFHIPYRLRAEHQGEVTAAKAQIVNPRPRGFFRWCARMILFFGIIGSICGGCLGLALFARYAKGIPVFRSLKEYKPALPSVFYSAEGKVLGEVAAERRLLVPYEKIPKKLSYAFIAAEDDRFFKHSGVDPLGILRAMVKNLKAGKVRAGGSTITQQVAKNFFFDRLVVHMKAGICRSDKQCGWRQRCVSKPGSAFGRCVKRSFQTCGRKVTVIYRGKPTQIYRGYSTMCDAHEICRPQCPDKASNNTGMCPKWTCMPMTPKPVCSTDAACGFGKRCVENECRPDFKSQLHDLATMIRDKGAVLKRIYAPTSMLEGLAGGFKRSRSRRIRISADEAGHIDSQKLEQLPGVKAIYRFAEKSIRRKIREAILATRLESSFSKEQILWLYMSQVFLGHGAYGVQAAAQNYFGKNVWELRLEEAATLAGLPKAPSAYDPYRRPKRAYKRMRYVLKRMAEMGYITEKERQEALIRGKKLHTRALPDLFRKRTPFFTEEARKKVLQKYGKDRLKKGGLRIFTTVDPEKQMLARKALRRGLEQLDMRQGYRGPLGIIPKENWDDALKRAAKYYGKKKLRDGQLYGALVTRVNNRTQRVMIQVGRYKGVIPLAGMRWAGKASSYNRYRRAVLNRVGQALKPGYWVLVEYVANHKKLRTKSRRIDRSIPSSGHVFRLRQHPKVEGAVLSIDPHSGYVEAMVGGYSYERSQFNRAMYACRQPGSSFKPVVYTAALEHGETVKKGGVARTKPITLGTILLDAPLVFDSTKDANASRYKPQNYDGRYRGEVPLYRALVSSMNIPSIKLMLRLGLDKALEYAKKFGFTTPLRKEMGLALGQSCVRPWELGQFYSMIANKGVRPETKMIKLVLDRNEQVVEEGRSFDDPTLSPEARLNRMEHEVFRRKVRVIRKETAFLVTHMLRGVVKGGTGYKVRKLGKPAAGKTGTTNDSFDVWFTGITPKHATIVWLGFDKNEKPLGAWESGGNTAAPVWLKYMKPATRGEKWKEWAPPPGISWTRIDPKTGKRANSDTSGALSLPFVSGTAPTQVSERRKGRMQAEDFYRNND